MGRRGVIYGRQSRTPGGGDTERSGGSGSESMDVQLAACRKIAKQYKVNVPKENEILEPPSTSAYKSRGHARPRFPELLGKLRSGEVDTLIAYRTDRLSRGGGPGWAPLLDAAEEAHLDLDRLVLVPGTGFMSEFEIGIRATMDREESKKTSERLRDMKVKHAAEGRPSGGGRTPFGYERNGRTIVPAEAEMIRDAARRLLAGEGVSSICRDWNQRGLVTNAGNPWRAGTLRNVLLNARLAGLRVHRGEIVGDASWPAITDRTTWERLQTELHDPARAQIRTGRVSLLYGVARCGRPGCGAKLVVASLGGRPAYRCQKGPGKPGCGGLAIVAEPLEALVTEMVLDALDSADLGERFARAASETGIDEELGRRITACERRLTELAEMWADGDITRAEWIAARARVTTELDALRLRASHRPRIAPLVGLGPNPRDVWPTLTKERRRAIAAAVLDRIDIGPARRGLNKFDPSRVSPTWRV